MAINKTHFASILAGIGSVYPNFKALGTPKDIEFWYAMLSDLTREQLENAVKRHIFSSPFPPTIADIRKAVVEGSMPKMDWSLGWGLVMQAIQRYGYYRGQEALDFLTEREALTAEVVRRLGFQNLCLSENSQLDRANFRMAYEAEVDKKKQDCLLPEGMRTTGELSMTKLALEAKQKAEGVIKLLADSKSMAEAETEKKQNEFSSLSAFEKALAYIEMQKGEGEEHARD